MNEKNIVLLCLGVIVVISTLTGCLKKKIVIENLKSFHYSYSVGYYMNAYVTYDIEKDNDDYIAKIKDAGMPPEEARTYNVTKKQIEEFETLLNENKIYVWNGFNKSDKNVMDGNSFSLSVNMEEKDGIYAHGYMKYPKNYGEVTGKIESWFSKIDIDKIEDESKK